MTTIPKTARPKTAPRFSRKAAQNDASGEGWARTAAASSPIGALSAAASAAMTDPRIDHAVDEIDQQIDADDDGRDQHHPALERRIVAPADRIDEPVADARPGEDGLRQHLALHEAGN